MTIGATEIVLLSVLAAAAWIFAAAMLRSGLRSCARYRAWRLRDEVVDDMIVGKLPASAAVVTNLVSSTERLVADVEAINLFAYILISSRVSDYDVDAYISHRDHLLAELTPEQRKLWSHHNDRHRKVFLHNTASGGLASFASVFLLAAIAFAAVLFGRLWKSAGGTVAAFKHEMRSSVEAARNAYMCDVATG